MKITDDRWQDRDFVHGIKRRASVLWRDDQPGTGWTGENRDYYLIRAALEAALFIPASAGEEKVRDQWEPNGADELPHGFDLANTLKNYTPGNWHQVNTIDELEAFYFSRLPVIRDAAREHGYAIGVHGSRRRDFDLIAMQWRDGASDPDTLAHSIAIAACGIFRDGPYVWEQKPSGRIATSFPICWTAWNGMISAGHIDLSLIPSAPSAPSAPVTEAVPDIWVCHAPPGVWSSGPVAVPNEYVQGWRDRGWDCKPYHSARPQDVLAKIRDLAALGMSHGLTADAKCEEIVNLIDAMKEPKA